MKNILFLNQSVFLIETCTIGYGTKNHFQNIYNFLNLDYFEKIKITINDDNYRNIDFFKIIQIQKVGYVSETIFHAEFNDAGFKVRKLTRVLLGFLKT